MLRKVLKVKSMMRRKTCDDILALPAIQGKAMEAGFRLIRNICTFRMVRGQRTEGAFSAMLAMELTLKHGIAPFSSTAVAFYGMMEVKLGHIDNGYKMGQLAMRLMERNSNRVADCSTMALTYERLLCWRMNVRDLGGPLYQAAVNGFDRGEVTYSTFCLSTSCFMEAMVCPNLAKLYDSQLAQYKRLAPLGQQKWVQPSLQYLTNLRSDSMSWPQLVCLSGEYMQEDEYLQLAESTDNSLLLFMTLRYHQAQLAYLFRFYDDCCLAFEKMSNLESLMRYTFVAPSLYFGGAMAHIGRYRQLGNRRDLTKARQYAKKLSRIDDKRNPNISAYSTCLALANTSLNARSTDIASITHALENGIEKLELSNEAQLCGCANEIAAFLFVELGEQRLAKPYFERAMAIYMNNWGSTAKYHWLQEKSGEIMDTIKEDEPFHRGADLVGGVIEVVMDY